MKSLDPAARLLAHARQRSVPIADCYDIKPDPSKTFAIVPVRVVGEEVIQAVGYGDILGAPSCVVEHHALSRRTAFLEPFGEALNDYLVLISESGFPRIIIPHTAALEVLTILAARYEFKRRPNPNPKHQVQEPSEVVQRLGYQCRLLNELFHTPGQQIVMVMTEAIRRHFVTGQNPAKDGHLGALSAWLNPSATGNTAEIADQIALRQPAAAMLPRAGDDAVEKNLHLIRRATEPAEKQRLQGEIEAIQRNAVLAEWEMLQQAHAAFWGRNLAPIQHHLLDKLATDGVEWLKYRLATPVARARRMIPMSQLHERYEFQQGLHKAVLIEKDRMRFDQERADGSAFVATITAIRKTPRGTQPKDHQIDIAIDYQPKIRLRPGREVRTISGPVVAKVRSFRQTVTGYDVTLHVLAGVKSLTNTGVRYEWFDSLPTDYPRIKQVYHEKVKALLGL